MFRSDTTVVAINLKNVCKSCGNSFCWFQTPMGGIINAVRSNTGKAHDGVASVFETNTDLVTLHDNLALLNAISV